MNELVAKARRYAAADPSDPFTLARALTHIRVGIATEDAPYDATLARGGADHAPAWRNVRRP